MTAKKPVATLTISPRPSGALTYLVHDAAGALLVEFRGYSTEHGRDRVRERLREWNQGKYKIEMKAAEEAA